MKAIPRIQLYQWGLLFLVIGVVLWVFVTATQQGQSQEDIQAYPPPPTDILTPFPSDNTATPEYTGCCATVYPTQTPIVASQTVDLSPDLGEGDEYLIYVEKNTGEIILYMIGPLQGDWRDSTLPDAVVEMLLLEPGDEIIWVDRPLPWAIRMLPETPLPSITPVNPAPYP